ncbi:hypothetical protein QE382_004132 [Sphingobacterium zeae]|uniref:Uncharacterized protein n=1 Tax=Sphingobacterium zeae TaxID=1776859 RepID=A0ABU0UBC5_9SPHI|nr:hypothetical protein [Sphingobacterium zeae]
MILGDVNYFFAMICCIFLIFNQLRLLSRVWIILCHMTIKIALEKMLKLFGVELDNLY